MRHDRYRWAPESIPFGVFADVRSEAVKKLAS